MDNHSSRKYLQQQVLSASPPKLVAMLHDRAIALLSEAIAAIEAGDIERRWRANAKATQIVCQLWEALDLEQGGEVAVNLDRLYACLLPRLTAVDVENSAQSAREVIELLEPLRRSWHKLASAGREASGTTQVPSDPRALQVVLSA